MDVPRSRGLVPSLATMIALAMLDGTFSGMPPACLAKSIVVEDFDVAINVEASGTLDVTETIQLRFDGQWNGIHRLIPVISKTPRGYDYRLRIVVKGVTDEQGKPLRYDRFREQHYDDLRIFVPGAADAVRTVVIRYAVRNGLRFFEDHDELFWNVTGDEWPYPIGAARARLTLPKELVNMRVNAFTGAYGTTGRDVEITVDGVRHAPEDAFQAAGESPPPPGEKHAIEVKASRPLGIREGLTVAVAWNPGTIRRPTQLENQLAWLRDNLGRVSLVGILLASPLLAFGALFDRWRRYGRDPRPGRVVVQYEPPAGLGPAEAGTLVDNSPDMRDLMALLVDLAVKGYLRIRETAKAGWFAGSKYAFDLLVPESHWGTLPRSERRLLEGLFESADTSGNGPKEKDINAVCTVTSQALENRFHEHLPDIRSAIFDALVEQGHYSERPDHVVSRYAATGVIGGLLLAAVAFAISQWALHMDVAPMLALCIASGLLTIMIVVGFGLIMPARTTRGVEARTAIRGFEEFLARVETHRLATMPLTPELFEKYLPYAMALGVERRWSAAFEGICREPPRWYVGSGPIGEFHATNFTGGLSTMSAVTAAAMQSAPRSSGGSGFGGGGGFSGGGGGFSGGGFGGGGGHGF